MLRHVVISSFFLVLLGLVGCGGGGSSTCREDASCGEDAGVDATLSDGGEDGSVDGDVDGGDASDDASTDAGGVDGAVAMDGGADGSAMDGAVAMDGGADGSAMDGAVAMDGGADGSAMDGGVDGGCVAVTYYADMDGDTWGDALATIDACELPAGYVLRAGDCDDAHAEARPGGVEVCDGLDNDCNGAVDEGVSRGCGSDVGACVAGTQSCAAGTWSSCVGEVAPSAEVCEGSVDENCDGTVDEGCGCSAGDVRACGSDVGACVAGTQTCVSGSWAACAGATDPAPEICDGVDNDCDGVVDQGDPRGGASCGGAVGTCVAGVMHCTAGALSCEGATGPATEVCDGVDNDCDGAVDEGVTTLYYLDGDGDGHGDAADVGVEACAPPAGRVSSHDDCDDLQPTVYPGHAEVCDGLDNDCDGAIDDGLSRSCGSDVGVCVAGTQSCAAGAWGSCVGEVAPSAEVCDGVLDENCDGTVDEGCGCTDGSVRACGSDVGACVAGTQTCAAGAWGACGGATDPAPEVCDGVDNDCDGSVDEGDPGGGASCGSSVGACVAGVLRCASGALSCQGETVATPEVCDGVDNDCDGTVDEGVTLHFYVDGDGDSYGDATDVGVDACSQPSGYSSDNSDCDDRSGATHPGAPEICDGVDNDCSGAIDDGLSRSCGSDVGVCVAGTQSCAAGAWGSCVGEVAPSAEVCDGSVDENCDGTVDEGCGCTDGSVRACGSDVGACVAGTQTCAAGAWGACAGATDAVPEVCDGVDNDCDGSVDEGDPGGGASCGSDVGACVAGVMRCAGGALSCQGATGPTAEVCDGVDNDCDGAVDEGLPLTRFYIDADLDDFGAADDPGMLSCSMFSPPGYSIASGDCDDANRDINPVATEVCDGVDNNCDGAVDEGLLTRYYVDRDLDDFGALGDPGVLLCAYQSGYSIASGDCDDANRDINPVATEVCDNVDNDCDGAVDEGLSQSCGTDVGACVAGVRTCAAGSWGTCAGEVTPAPEVCDGVDNDCDGAVDEGDPGGGASCGSDVGACIPGTTRCVGGVLGCVGPWGPDPEVCDGIDNDCDGLVDEGVQLRSFPDVDGDSFGDASDPGVLDCVIGAGYVADNTDCDDADPNAHPGGNEICDGADNDCDGVVDGVDASAWCNLPAQSLPHAAAATCSAGACTVVACQAGFGSCDADGTNGCESNLNTDDLNCGTCGKACALGAGSCSAGSCDDAVQVTSGWWHSCLLRASGVIDCWGANSSGELGNGTTTDSPTLTRVSGISNAIAVFASANHTCALLATGRVKCWGWNTAGQLGDGTTTDRSTPVTVAGINDATRIAAGWLHSCARVVGGAVRCWGGNDRGQLGDGTFSSSSTPVTVVNTATGGLHGLVAGFEHTCALTSGGVVYCWGANGSGQLGDGTTTGSNVPVAATASAATYVQVVAGRYYSCARRAGGGTKCWGSNVAGQLGDGTTTDRLRPTAVPGVSAASLVAGNRHTCAIEGSGSMRCWGGGGSGRLGYGGTSNQTSPIAVLGMSAAAEASAGSNYTCSLFSSGAVQCWGSNDHGQLGDGTGVRHLQPETFVIP